MHVLHTAGVPPSSGSTILPTIGCTTNKSPAPRKMVAEYNSSTAVCGPVIVEIAAPLCDSRWSARASSSGRTLTSLYQSVDADTRKVVLHNPGR